MTRVYLDANVIMAASLSRGPSRIVSRLAQRHKDIALVTTEYGLDEAERNVQRWKPHRLNEFRKTRARIQVYPEPTDALVKEVGLSIPRKKRPRKKDWPILTGAYYLEADYLVTRDQCDFGRLYNQLVYGVEIVRPTTLLNRLR